MRMQFASFFSCHVMSRGFVCVSLLIRLRLGSHWLTISGHNMTGTLTEASVRHRTAVLTRCPYNSRSGDEIKDHVSILFIC